MPPPKMHFILVSNLYPNSTEPERALYNQRHFEAVAALGHTVEVIAPVSCLQPKGARPPKDEQIGPIRVWHPPFFYPPGVLIHRHDWFYRLATSKLLKERIEDAGEKVNVVLGFVFPDAVALAPLLRALGVDYSVLVLGSDFRIRRKQPKFREKVLDCLKKAPAVFCPGRVLRHDMIAEGVPGERIHPFNNGVDPEIFFPDPGIDAPDPQPQKNELLFVGNFVEVKAPERTIRAFAEVAAAFPSLQLVMVGKGPMQEKLLRLAQGLGIADRVLFAGRLPPSQVAEKMRSASCLILSSRSEGMPNVVIEAMACGCPVVATAVGEVPELIDDGVNGFAVPAAGMNEAAISSGLADSIRKVLDQRMDRKTIAGRMTDYSWRNAAQVIIEAVGATNDQHNDKNGDGVAC